MWKAFNIRFPLAQPLAVGVGWRLGFVNLTRLDIPPRTLWGAFAQAVALSNSEDVSHFFTPDHAANPNKTRFDLSADWVAANLRFLPGILTARRIRQENSILRILPWYEFGAGDCCCVLQADSTGRLDSVVRDPAAIRSLFVRGRGATALEYGTSIAAEEGMLHETERIMPMTRIGNDLWNVELETVVFFRDDGGGNTSDKAKSFHEWLRTQLSTHMRIGRDIAVGDGCFHPPAVTEVSDMTDITQAHRLDVDQTVEWVRDNPAGPILEVTPRDGDDSVSHSAIRLPGPCLIVPGELGTGLLQGYWGDAHPFFVREWDRDKGYGRKIGYAGEKPIWILEHGGIVAVPKNVPVRAQLDRDGWRLLAGSAA